MMLVECKKISELHSFEYEVAEFLCSSSISGFALVSPTLEYRGTIYEVDFILLLRNGNIVCIEAKGYKGEWTGSLNQPWYANGKIISCSRGKTPIEQCNSYAAVVKNKLELILNTQNFFVYAIIVTPDETSFNLDFGYELNKIGLGKSTNICQLSKLTKALTELKKDEGIEQKFLDLGGKRIICYLTGMSHSGFDKALIADVEVLKNRRMDESVSDKPKDSMEAIYEAICSVAEPSVDIGAEEVTPEVQLDLNQTVETNKRNPVIFALLLSIIPIAIASFFINRLITKDRSVNLVIGGLGSSKSLSSYQELRKYLGKTWENVSVDVIDESNQYSYLQAKQKIRNGDWSIVFTFSPTLSAEAERFGYKPIATMFPGSNSYQSILLANKTSKIESITELDESFTVILKNTNSASGFYFPLYELYQAGAKRGKPITVKVEFDADSKTAKERILKNNNLVGFFSYPSKEGEFKNFKEVFLSRTIPGSQVYISPKILEYEDKITKKLLDAPLEIRKQLEYGSIDKPQDYTEMNQIIEKVDELFSCDDYRKGLVTIGCDSTKEKSVLTVGKIFRVDPRRNDDVLNVQTKDSICKFTLPKNVSQEIMRSYRLNSIGELPRTVKEREVTIRHTLDLKVNKCEPNREYKIYDLSQINF